VSLARLVCTNLLSFRAKIRAVVFGTRQRTSVTTNEVVFAFNAQIQLVIVQKECQVRLNRGRDLIKMLHPDRT
jgi:hypothetical protein